MIGENRSFGWRGGGRKGGKEHERGVTKERRCTAEPAVDATAYSTPVPPTPSFQHPPQNDASSSHSPEMPPVSLLAFSLSPSILATPVNDLCEAAQPLPKPFVYIDAGLLIASIFAKCTLSFRPFLCCFSPLGHSDPFFNFSEETTDSRRARWRRLWGG